MSVAAVNSNRGIASFSTHNDKVDIAGPGKPLHATKLTSDLLFSLDLHRISVFFLLCSPFFFLYPGVSVTSAWNNGRWATISGTSMATPHVSGVAALLKSKFPSATPLQLYNAIVNTADDRGTVGRDDFFGHGIVRALKAMQELESLVADNGGSAGGDNGTGDNGGSDGGSNGGSGKDGTDAACVDVAIAFRTDAYPHETSYTLKGTDGTPYWNTDGVNLRKNQSYVQKSCLDPALCYRFDIIDTWGDGISGTGIKLSYDDTVLFQGGNFGYGGHLFLGGGC